MLVLASSTTAYGTFAFFSDTETSTDNIFTAGDLDLTLDGLNGVTATIVGTNFAPGDATSGSVVLRNEGSIFTGDAQGHLVDIDFYATAHVTDDTGNLADADDGAASIEGFDRFLQLTTFTYGAADLLPTIGDEDGDGRPRTLADLEAKGAFADLADPGAAGRTLSVGVLFLTSGQNDLKRDRVDLAFTFFLSQAGEVDLVAPASGSGGSTASVQRLTLGGGHNCVLLAGGNVDCWGYNVDGQANDHFGGDAVGVEAGELNTCIVTTSANAHCWGSDFMGQSAGYTGGDAAMVSAGSYHACALTTAANVVCWGNDFFGQSTAYNGGDVVHVEAGYEYTCFLKTGGNVDCQGRDDSGQLVSYTAGDAVQVAAGERHTCILKTSGNVECWGESNDGKTASYLGGDAVQLAVGPYHTCVLTAAGNADCWGRNTHGQTADYNGGDATWLGAGQAHTCVLTTGDVLRCWGSDEFGQAPASYPL